MMKYNIGIKVRHITLRRAVELVATCCLIIGTVLLLISGIVLNPFEIKTVKSDKQIEKAYYDDISYIKLEQQSLDFSGYYKMDKDGKIVYNCYVAEFDETKFFVFIPNDKSVDESGNAKEELKDYNLIGRLKEDEKLFEMVAEDYQLSAEEVRDKYNISSIIIDEAGAKRQEVGFIWITLFTLLSSYFIYLVVLLFREIKIGGTKDEKE
ncbi:hypothetical protein [Anaeromicropila populeti]|uniref:Uncharacterized protein n=1 Tax=Anaeromicropila populeti TaxID=37658 RepID=A0A1I6I7T0_9FIRM|nr:hypothetical protein [Anaeromicropila populeti]SFR62741.1 hypothetical protein SAMN05661086_00519 [Anaeromicropila populeti]